LNLNYQKWFQSISKSSTEKQEKSCEKSEVEALDTKSSQSKLVFDCGVETPVQEFYVCFSGCGDYLGSSKMKNGFNHVSIMEKLDCGFIVHDPNKYALDTYILPGVETVEFISRFLHNRPDYTLLEVSKEATVRTQRHLRLGMQSCVSIVAYIMGIKLPFYCLTPHSLYKYLVKGGQGILRTRRLSNVTREKRSSTS
jgi:hypothetical protein